VQALASSMDQGRMVGMIPKAKDDQSGVTDELLEVPDSLEIPACVMAVMDRKPGVRFQQ